MRDVELLSWRIYIADQVRLQPQGQVRTDRWLGRLQEPESDFNADEVVNTIIGKLGEVEDEPA